MLTGNRKGYYVSRDKVFPLISFLLLLILTKHCCDHLKESPVINFKGSGTGCGGSRVIFNTFLSVIFHVRIFISMH